MDSFDMGNSSGGRRVVFVSADEAWSRRVFTALDQLALEAGFLNERGEPSLSMMGRALGFAYEKNPHGITDMMRNVAKLAEEGEEELAEFVTRARAAGGRWTRPGKEVHDDGTDE